MYLKQTSCKNNTCVQLPTVQVKVRGGVVMATLSVVVETVVVGHKPWLQCLVSKGRTVTSHAKSSRILPEESRHLTALIATPGPQVAEH